MASAFKSSPVPFVRFLMARVRRSCDSIQKTHVGKILDGVLLTEADFASRGGSSSNSNDSLDVAESEEDVVEGFKGLSVQ